MKNQNKCKLDSAGVFVGFTTMPTGLGVYNFFNTQISHIFQNYKEGISSNYKKLSPKWNQSDDGKEFENYFYQPKGYFLFGEFDLLVLSLIDDFELPIRGFKPFSPLITNSGSKEEPSNEDTFAHKVIVGPSPISNLKTGIKEIAKRTFLIKKDDDRFPLISISKIKLNNTVLVKYGIKFMRGVIHAINKIVETQNTKNTRIECLIVESYSWYEISLIMFSNSYKPMVEVLTEVRKLNFDDIDVHLGTTTNTFGSDFQYKVNGCPQIDELDDNSRKFVPLIKNTITYFGFDIDLFSQLNAGSPSESKIIGQIDSNQYISARSTLFLRTGNLNKFIRDIFNTKDQSFNYVFKYNIGRGDVSVRYQYDSSEIVPLNKFLPEFCYKFSSKHIDKYIQSISTKIDLVFDIDSNIAVSRPFKKCFTILNQYRDFINSSTVKINDLKQIGEKLRSYGISKVQAESVQKSIANFNHGIQDPNLYIYFLELRNFIFYIISRIFRISDFKSQSSFKEKRRDLSLLLRNATTAFMSAYQNRFQASYITSDIWDYNVYFSGSFQIVLTAYDGLFKSVSSILGNDYSFIMVEGNPLIETEIWCLHINYLHLFQPEIVIPSMVHEASINLLSSELGDKQIPKLSEDDKSKLVKAAKNVLSITDIFDDNGPYFQERLSTSIASLIGNTGMMSKKSIYNNVRHQLKDFGDSIELLREQKLYLHIYSDLFSYYFIYCGDVDLFSKMHWGIFLSSSESYSVRFSFDEKSFRVFMLRYLSVLRVVGVDEECYQSLPYSQPEFSVYYEKYFYECSNIVDKIIMGEGYYDWIESIKTCLEILIKNHFNSNFNNHLENITKNTDEIVGSLQDGHTYTFDEKVDYINYLQLVYSYLKICRKFINPEHILLTRNKANGTHTLTRNDTGLLFDPNGGSFIASHSLRKDMFKIRSAFMMSIWDLSLKRKYDYITNS